MRGKRGVTWAWGVWICNTKSHYIANYFERKVNELNLSPFCFIFTSRFFLQYIKKIAIGDIVNLF